MSHTAQRLVVLTTLGLSALLQACGGGSEIAAPIEAPMATSANVRLEGCVVDQYYVPNEGVPVRVLTGDGRTLAWTRSGRMGEFVVQVPAGTRASLAVDRVDGERLSTPALDRDRVVDNCLVARN